LVILVCQDQLNFIFFPFISDDGTPCVDAIVTPGIALFDGSQLIDLSWFAFICFYINELFQSNLEFIKPSQVPCLKFHPKKTLIDRMELTDTVQQLQSELQEQKDTIKLLKQQLAKVLFFIFKSF